MVDNTIQSVLNAEHKLESMVESSTDGSTEGISGATQNDGACNIICNQSNRKLGQGCPQ